jgi:hypothetical protein
MKKRGMMGEEILMKTRNGFVSNSSSSSFIVAANKKLNGIVSLTIEVDLNSYASSVIDNLDDLSAYFKENYDEDYEENEDYIGSKKAIESGRVVFAGSFNSEEGGLEGFLCEHGIVNMVNPKNLDVNVIQGEGGY